MRQARRVTSSGSPALIEERGLSAPVSGNLATTSPIVGLRSADPIKDVGPDVSPLSGSVRRVTAWAREHPIVVDVVVAAIFCALAVASVRLVQLSVADADREIAAIRPSAEAALKQGGEAKAGAERLLDLIARRPTRIAMPWIYLLAVLSTAPLAFRRRRSNSVHLIVFSAFVVTVYVSPVDAQIAQGAAWLSTYSFAAYATNSKRYRQSVLAVTSVLTVLFVTGLVRNKKFYPDPIQLREAIFGFFVIGMLYLSSIAFGVVMRRHRETTQTLAAQASALALQQTVLARTVVLDERVRIARELHDVVAHHVSVMGMQAGAARLRLGPGDSPVSAALTTIEQSSREAVADLYRLLGLLRSETEITGAEVQSPQPSLLLLSELVADHERSGYQVSLSIEGDLEVVPSTASLTGYRIAQEALTNIRKHAKGSGVATIAVVARSDSLHLTVTNSVPLSRVGTALPGDLNPAMGLGIRGMIERATLLGGTLVAGPTESHGFIVRAELPFHSRGSI